MTAASCCRCATWSPAGRGLSACVGCDAHFCTASCGFTCGCGVALCERAGCGGPAPRCACGKKLCGMCEGGVACSYCGAFACESCKSGLYCERAGCSIFSCDGCGRVQDCKGCSYTCDGEECGGELESCFKCDDVWCARCADGDRTATCARCDAFGCKGCVDARACEGCGDAVCGRCEPAGSQPTCTQCHAFWCSRCLVGDRFTCPSRFCMGESEKGVCPTPQCAGYAHECADCGALFSCDVMQICGTCCESGPFCGFCATTALGTCEGCDETRCVAVCGRLQDCSGGCGARVCDEMCEKEHECPGPGGRG